MPACTRGHDQEGRERRGRNQHLATTAEAVIHLSTKGAVPTLNRPGSQVGRFGLIHPANPFGLVNLSIRVTVIIIESS